MKRIFRLAVCAILALNLAACGKIATTVEIEQAIANALGEDYICQSDMERETLERELGLDMSKIKEYTAKYEAAADDVAPSTVIVLRTEKGYADTAVEMLNRALTDTVMEYGWTDAVTNARIYTSGSYVIYVIFERAIEGGTDEYRRAAVNADYAAIDAALTAVLGELSENKAMIPEYTPTERAV